MSGAQITHTSDAAFDADVLRIRIVKLNVDENAASAAKFNIRSIPTLLLFNKGAVVARQVGAVSQSHLRAFLDAQLREAVA